MEATKAQEGGSSPRPRARITQRDEQALAWLVQQRAATVPQVARLLCQISGSPVSDRRARQVVARWEALGLATRWMVWQGEAAIVVPTAQAAKQQGLERWRRPAIGTLRHTIAAAEARLQLAPFGGTRQWYSESELRREAPRGEHVADGGWQEDEGAVAVEVELTSHGKVRVRSTIKGLLAAHRDGKQRWTHVLYLCSQATYRQVDEARSELVEADRRRVFVRRLP